MNKIKEYNSLPRLLSNQRYRPLRHLSFIIIIVFISFNQVFIAYDDSVRMLGNRIYLICFFQFALYLLAIYFHYFYLTPKLLLKGKHVVYLTALFVMMLSLPSISILTEYWVRSLLDIPHRITNYTSPLILIDNLAASTITAICVCGVSFGKIFQEWIAVNNHIHQLEQEHLQFELNKLKGQLAAPEFLSRTLSNASDLTRKNPAKATLILIQLGKLLRYQLYDCNRDILLLRSEIDFLTRLLKLDQYNHSSLHFDIRVRGNINNIFVAPFLFSPLVQQMSGSHTSLDITFVCENGSLIFKCESNNRKAPDKETLSLMNKRLQLRYSKQHVLVVRPGMAELEIVVP